MTDDEIIAVVTARKNGKIVLKHVKRGLYWQEMDSCEEFNFKDYDYFVGTKLPTSWKEYCLQNGIVEDYIEKNMPFIGSLCGVSKSQGRNLANRLQSEGMVELTPDPNRRDGRLAIFITPKGRSYVKNSER